LFANFKNDGIEKQINQSSKYQVREYKPWLKAKEIDLFYQINLFCIKLKISEPHWKVFKPAKGGFKTLV